MGDQHMGRVVTEATVENLQDLWDAKRGLITPDQVRRITVPDALADTCATSLAMPTPLIQQLGLEKRYNKCTVASTGLTEIAVYEAARLTIQGRDVTTDVMEVPDEVPVLIGQIPLEWLDLVVDTRNRRLTPKPAHGGEHILELL